VTSAADAILPDVVQEAGRLLGQARAAGVSMYLLGGVAIAIRREGKAPLLSREFKDIDFFTPKGGGAKVRGLLQAAGYRPDVPFNAMNGRRRLLFWDDANGRQIDVFTGEFEMSHRLPLAETVPPCATTIPLADLLATKLQIYELNPKDQIDILNLLHDHPVVPGLDDDSGISAARLARLCSQDWAFWRTTKLNVERTFTALDQGAIEATDAADLARARLSELWEAIEREPKPGKWRRRDRIGDRVRWYELPDEVR